MKRVLIYTKDEYLFSKISLEIGDFYECESAIGLRPSGDFLIWDVDTMGECPDKNEYITVGRTEGAELVRPFLLSDITRALESKSALNAPLEICSDGHSVRLNGEKIALTDIELTLFSALFKRRGSFASRAELLDEVWGRESDGTLLNVYVHYLREKLERHGEKLIISSRKNGYKISEKYFLGKGDK